MNSKRSKTSQVGQGQPANFALVVLTTSMAFVVGQLDVTIVNVALPAIGADLHGAIEALQWIVDAYTVAFAACMLCAGALGDRFGAKRAFQMGMTIFMLASLACALAPDVLILDACRALQGLGAAIMLPNSLALLNHAFAHQPAQRARGIGYWTAAGAVSIAAGPVLGGILVSSAGWRGIFWVNIPLCLLGLWLSRRMIETVHSDTRLRVDLSGQILATLALACLTGCLIEARAFAGHELRVVTASLVMLALCIVLWWVERRAQDPVIAMDLFAQPNFRSAVLFGMAVNGTYYGTIFVLAIYLQTTRHYSALQAGLAFLPITAGFFLSNVFSGRVIARFGTRIPMIVGALIDLLGFAALAMTSASTPYVVMIIPFLLIPTGMGLAVPAMTTTVLSSTEKRRSSLAAAILNTARQAAGAVGVALFGGLMQGGGADLERGLRMTCVVCAVILALAALNARRMKGSSVGRHSAASAP